MSKLILILGDQLSEDISSLKHAEKGDLIVMMEVHSETDYVKHHKRKLLFLFSAMRHFALKLRESGLAVKYFKLDDPDNQQDFIKNIQQVITNRTFETIVVTEPAEYRLLQQFEQQLAKLNGKLALLEDDRFFLTKPEFFQYAQSSKNLKLENFYRFMRKRTGYLMDKDQPYGGKWNYDHENRRSYDGKTAIPARLSFPADDIVTELTQLIEKEFPDRFGSLENFNEAVTRQQALQRLDFFVEECLDSFGRYQDAMVQKQALLFHSRLSHLINCGLLHPKEVCDAVLQRVGQSPLAAIEGFIRQIIGWREYIRGIYWLHMPGYLQSNFFKHSRPLPAFYWSGDCAMNCVKEVVNFTQQIAYSHHIQRLMITGNLALLMEVNPIEVHEWYLAVYDDAYEWVELPNTLGMALHADGGLMATKPYIASGNYINKMSDYCSGCSYNVKEKTGSSACPFNYLYWNFLINNKEKLANNHRLFMPYRNLAKKNETDIKNILASSKQFLAEHDH